MELGVAAFFVLSYWLWPGGFETAYDFVHFGLWLVAGVIMAILLGYDQKWYLLPDKLNLALAVIGLAVVAVVSVESNDVGGTLLSALGSVGVLAGLYAALYVVSRGQWVGFGDVKLGVGLGLLLLDWQLALAALFLANFIGCLIVIPLMLAKKLQRHAQIPFGPLLIAGTVIAWLFGPQIIAFYLGAFTI